MELIYFGKRYSYLMPHVAGTFHNAMDFHKKIWPYDHKRTYVFLTDMEDDGHGGALVMPFNTVILGISPFNFAFSIVPSSERFQWLFNHELTHITMADKASRSDLAWRKVMLGKVTKNERAPLSAIFSYLTTPRWYAPRWYHEGIACYMETWMSGGIGRSMGPYDEMYFRSIIHSNEKLYSVIGLETEGTTIDFQVGANSYLYGSRFVTYMAQAHGMDKLKAFYARDDESKAFYARQFKKVYGFPLRLAWQEWKDFEALFQKTNLKEIREYPVTQIRPLSTLALGSISNVAYNPATNKVYAAVNHPGDISRLVEIDLKSGKVRKVAILDSPMLYSVAYIAYDPGRNVLFVTEQNSKFRKLVEVDVQSGKKQTKIRMSRTGNLVFNTSDGNIWGIRHDNGYASLVKIPPPYTDIQPMYTARFGQSLLDLSISNSGKYLSASLTGIRGEQSIILFDLENLEKGIHHYDTVLCLDDNTLTQFRFSLDDKSLIGSSYYNGVSNIWQVSLEDKAFELLSNAETGLFMPIQLSTDSLFVLEFQRHGMRPGFIPYAVVSEANAIQYLGNLVIDKNPELEAYSLDPASGIDLDSVGVEELPYSSLKNMRLAHAYPDIAGYKNSIVLGYRLNWRDRIGLSNIDLFLAGSPWSNYADNQKVHAVFSWDYWNWRFAAAYNYADFYDLFGPTKRSRAGYSTSLGYKWSFNLWAPFKWQYGISLHHYGNLEVLPQYQNVVAPIRNFQYLSFDAGMSKLRKTLGGVDDEKGYSWNASVSSTLANEVLYPALVSEQNVGWLVPGIRNTSFWIRSSLGQNFGPVGSSMSRFYFGGFRNNFVDWQPSEQYRKLMAFPGHEIDGIGGRNFVKTMGELNLRPIRLRNIGATWLYPTFLKFSGFGTHLMLDADRAEVKREVLNAGAQMDVELVLFSYLKTTWSVGYARTFESGIPEQAQWMFSVKLLGN